MIVNAAIVLLILLGAYLGAKRGAFLIAFECVSLAVATSVAAFTYAYVTGFTRAITGQTAAASDVLSFVAIWMVVEVVSALIIRRYILRRYSHHGPPERASRVFGALFNAAKYAAYLLVALIILVSLPMSQSSKAAFTNPTIPHFVLSSTGLLKSWQSTDLGQSVATALDFYTISSDPESTERIALGYKTTVYSPDPTAEAQMLTLLNQARTSRGLKPLTVNSVAREVARAHSADMFAQGYFSHLTPSGQTPFDRMSAAGITFGAAGENLALAPTVTLAFQGLMASPPHKANILNVHFRTVGIGIMDGGPYGLMVTQDFTD